MSALNPIHTDGAPEAIGPYSQAMEVDGMVYCSGQIPLIPGTMELVTGDVADQAEQVMKNLSAVLAAAGCTLQDVVKTTIFLSSMDSFATVNEVYGRHMGEHRPARATVAVAGLPKGVDVEIEVMARRP